ncbi:hypothetical protein HO173_012048 [Letharia columbiana]|uniref:Uncharacterized protein n=1 Tax=Letharia columbiana TaxID=112416 RepID=A0A8H6FH62_9LECA|nr:uncharacterized protein HO173_012048 [Letharia columbiana]KAF6227718.1 hypothetical protein HO173_012048 [Letharia columbiana]
MELNWAPDHCLACDKQTECETYCSQSCRLADLEKSANWSGSTSPTTPSWTSSDSNRGSGFYLSPAFNFAAYKTTQTTPNWPTSPQTSYFSTTTTTTSSTTQNAPSRTLSPSSSRSSLTSTTTTSSTSSHQTPLSEQARSELRGYTNSFDSTRNWRRRMTWS